MARIPPYRDGAPSRNLASEEQRVGRAAAAAESAEPPGGPAVSTYFDRLAAGSGGDDGLGRGLQAGRHDGALDGIILLSTVCAMFEAPLRALRLALRLLKCQPGFRAPITADSLRARGASRSRRLTRRTSGNVRKLRLVVHGCSLDLWMDLWPIKGRLNKGKGFSLPLGLHGARLTYQANRGRTCGRSSTITTPHRWNHRLWAACRMLPLELKLKVVHLYGYSSAFPHTRTRTAFPYVM